MARLPHGGLWRPGAPVLNR
jgi:hypothetical protein